MRLALPEKAQSLIADQDVAIEVLTFSEPLNLEQEKLIVTGIAKEDGKTLFVKNTKPDRSWEFPSGHVEENESLEDAIRREFKEETGYSVTRTHPELLLVWTFTDAIVTQVVFSVEHGEQIQEPVEEVCAVEWKDELPAGVSFGNVGRDTFEELLEYGEQTTNNRLATLLNKNVVTEKKRNVAVGALTSGVVLLEVLRRYRQKQNEGT